MQLDGWMLYAILFICNLDTKQKIISITNESFCNQCTKLRVCPLLNPSYMFAFLRVFRVTLFLARKIRMLTFIDGASLCPANASDRGDVAACVYYTRRHNGLLELNDMIESHSERFVSLLTDK